MFTVQKWKLKCSLLAAIKNESLKEVNIYSINSFF